MAVPDGPVLPCPDSTRSPCHPLPSDRHYDDFDELGSLADLFGDDIDGEDSACHQAASCLSSCGFQFHGSRSGSFETGMSGMRARTSASYA